MGSRTGDGSNQPESQTASPGAITGLSNFKRKMAAIDLEREAFKVDQASLRNKLVQCPALWKRQPTKL
jgi:hypothetical protein